jgi:hypothetical protein
MKYKIGDRVIVKREGWSPDADSDLQNQTPPYTFEISDIKYSEVYQEQCYIFVGKNQEWHWAEDQLELFQQPKSTEPIKNRFEILDL